jgi:hypothetical protein
MQRTVGVQGASVVALQRLARVENSAFGERRSATTTDPRRITVRSSKAQDAMDHPIGGCMRTEKLMINADSETIAAFSRANAVKAAAALTLVFSLAAISFSAPAHASGRHVTIESLVASGNDPVIDEHDFISAQKSIQAARGAIELERLFWMCDYAATAGILQDDELEMCGAAVEQMKLARFDGDYDKLLAWWRLNKETEHQALFGAGVVGYCAREDA